MNTSTSVPGLTALLRGQGIPDFAKAAPRKEEWPIYEGIPRQYLFDGGEGLFKCAEDWIGEYISIHPFDYQFAPVRRWGRLRQSWLDLLFVDKEGFVSILCLKKASAVNLHQILLECRKNGLDYCSLQLNLKAEPRTGLDGSSWYVVGVPIVTYVDPERVERLRQFKAEGKYSFTVTGEEEYD